ncbi:hypothetical protein [Phenylobacterium soli]|uniref:DUF3047 domain-containing protein n=1 Tax=Phenylobacterium soli TaxID=2170551 RepID=A0A328AJK6_9CAUL|nr:hypothetical protein [Phenylobacterium soli]RAK54671.1 hypothetical protein DJ017_09130 [Phenylobacterium soli]
MLKTFASAAALALLASPALAETWHVMGATPAELLMMETDSRYAQPNGDVSVWTSSVKVGEQEEPVVKALWQVSCKGEPRIRPQMVVWYDGALNSKESWTATRKDGFQPVVPGSRGDLTWQYACGKKAWPISISGSFGEVTGAYANALAKLVDATSEVAAR